MLSTIKRDWMMISPALQHDKIVRRPRNQPIPAGKRRRQNVWSPGETSRLIIHESVRFRQTINLAAMPAVNTRILTALTA